MAPGDRPIEIVNEGKPVDDDRLMKLTHSFH